MLRALVNIRESFQLGGGRLSVKGLQLIGLNVALTWSLIALVGLQGNVTGTSDIFSLVIDSGAVVVHFLVYCMTALIPLKRWIKLHLIAGLMLTQLGLLLSLLDHMVETKEAYWHLLGGITYLIGAIFVALGGTHWVVYIYRMSTLDTLTRVHNRRFFEAILRQYLHRLKRSPESACLLNLDLDDFKAVNDQYGHDKGDAVLRHVAQVLRLLSRDADVICRSGGEEFEMLLPGATLDQANRIAQRLLAQLREGMAGEPSTITASIGITEVDAQDTTDTVRKRADDAMYEAKRTGKARVVMHAPAF